DLTGTVDDSVDLPSDLAVSAAMERSALFQKELSSLPQTITQRKRCDERLLQEFKETDEALDRLLVWFSKNQHWPVIRWFDRWSETVMKKDFVMHLDCSQKNQVLDFTQKLLLTGASRTTNKNDNECDIFANRPFLVMLGYDREGLDCKIVF